MPLRLAELPKRMPDNLAVAGELAIFHQRRYEII